MKKIISIILCLMMVLSFTACDNSDKNKKDIEVDTSGNIVKEIVEEVENKNVIELPFEETLNFSLSNGVGNWNNDFYLKPDGTFSGNFYDLDMGETGEDYSNGTYYYNEYSGTIKGLKAVDLYSFEFYIDEIEYKYEKGTEKIEDEIKNVAIDDITGVNKESRYILYVPYVPVKNLPETIDTWLLGIDLRERISSGLYILYNETEEMAFYYDDGKWSSEKVDNDLEEDDDFPKLEEPEEKYTVEPIDAEKYYNDVSTILEIIDVKDSNNVHSEKEVFENFEKRGFFDFSITTDYDMDGNYFDSIEISRDSDEKHPIYQAFYVDKQERYWTLTEVNGEIFADPISYEFDEDYPYDYRILFSESESVIGYDGYTNKFYVNVPNGTDAIVRTVDEITADVLDNYKFEE